MQDHLRECRAPVIAVSPVVGGSAIKGPTVKMMAELSVPNTATWVAQHYRSLLDGFVLDTVDEGMAADIESMGLTTVITNTVMVTLEDRIGLARACLQLTATLRDI
jgi:LPPG:FO 2-phospho-L-lactate transferase